MASARSSCRQARVRCSTSRRVSARESSLVYSPSVRTRASPQRALSTIDAASLDDSGSPAKEPLHTVVCCMVHESHAASRRTYKPNGCVVVSDAARAVRVAVRVRRVTHLAAAAAAGSARCCFVSGHTGSAGYPNGAPHRTAPPSAPLIAARPNGGRRSRPIAVPLEAARPEAEAAARDRGGLARPLLRMSWRMRRPG